VLTVENMSSSDFIAAYAAFLSTILAFNEFYLKRLRIDTSFFLTGEEGSPDIITIFNQSDKSIVISHFELFSAVNKNDKNKKSLYTGREGQSINLSIGPNVAANIEFSDQYKINAVKDKLFMVLHIMGRKKTITKFIC